MASGLPLHVASSLPIAGLQPLNFLRKKLRSHFSAGRHNSGECLISYQGSVRMTYEHQYSRGLSQGAVSLKEGMPGADRAEAQLTEKILRDEGELLSLRGRRSISVSEAASIEASDSMKLLAQVSWRQAGSHTRHYCLRSVTNVLLAGDVIDSRIAPRAIDAVPVLRRNSAFVEVKGVKMSDLASLPEGTVVIYEKPGYGTGAAGHAQILCGNGRAASDFRHDLNVYQGTPRQVFAFIPLGGGDSAFRTSPQSAEDKARPSLTERCSAVLRKLPFFGGRNSHVPAMSPGLEMAPSSQASLANNNPVSTSSEPQQNDAQANEQAKIDHAYLSKVLGWEEGHSIKKRLEGEQNTLDEIGKALHDSKERRKREKSTDESKAGILTKV